MKSTVSSLRSANLAALALLSLAVAAGQPVLPSAGETVGENRDASGASSRAPSLLRRPTTAESPFTVGPLTIRPHALYRVVHSDGMLITPGNPITTYIQDLAPGILLQAGQQWRLDYTPTWTLYSNAKLRNTVGHSVKFDGSALLGDWSAHFAQNYDSSSGVLIETASQTRRQIVVTDAGVSRSFGEKFGVEVSGNQDLEFIERTNDMFNWTGSAWGHYAASRHLDLAAGGSMGYVQIYHTPDIVMSSPGAQLNWHPGDALSVQLQAGLQTARFVSGGRRPLHTVAYDGTVAYTPREGTTLLASAHHLITPSFFTNNVTENHTWSVTLQQRVLQHFQASVGYDERYAHYILTQHQIISDATVEEIKDEAGNVIALVKRTTLTPVITFVARDDAIRSASFRVSTTWLRRGMAALTYRHSRNHSTAPGYGYVSHQFGCEISWKY